MDKLLLKKSTIGYCAIPKCRQISIISIATIDIQIELCERHWNARCKKQQYAREPCEHVTNFKN